MTFVPFQDLTAASLNHLRLAAYKTANETVNNSSTLQNDDHLVLAIPAGTVYACHLHFMFTTGTTPNMKIEFSVPSGGALYSGTVLAGNTGSGVQHVAVTSGTMAVAFQGHASDTQGFDLWFLSSCPNAGNLQLRWAQNTANASNSVIHAGGWLVAERIV